MSHDDFISDLVQWIDNHIEGKMDLDTVADRAGYSKWHLQRMFKQHTGYALGEYIRQRRLKNLQSALHAAVSLSLMWQSVLASTRSSPSTAVLNAGSDSHPGPGGVRYVAPCMPEIWVQTGNRLEMFRPRSLRRLSARYVQPAAPGLRCLPANYPIRPVPATTPQCSFHPAPRQ